jgi:hypothetical protein
MPADFPAAPVVDSFSRDDGPLGATWYVQDNSSALPSFKVASGQIVQDVNPGDASNARWIGSGPFQDCDVFFTIASLDPFTDPGYRDISVVLADRTLATYPDWNGYAMDFEDSGAGFVATIYRLDVGTGVTALVSAAADLQAGDRIGLRRTGTTYTGYRWRDGVWTQILSVSDGTHTGLLLPGVGGYWSGWQIDDFGAGEVLAETITTPTPRGRWRFVVCDVNGTSLGEPNSSGRRFRPAVSGTATASFSIRTTDPFWDQVTADGTYNLKVYDSTGALRLYGPIVAEEEQDGPSSFTAADLSFDVGKRFIGRDDDKGIGRKWDDKDSGRIVFDMLDGINDDDFPTGILPGMRETFVPRTVTYLWKNVLTAINELGAIAGSYEWLLRYVDQPFGVAPLVYLDLVTRMGADRTGDVFVEYGFGKHNLKGYRRLRTIERMATRIFVLGGAATQVVKAYDAGAEARLHKRYEDVVTFPDITVDALLDALAAAHIAIRNGARETIELPVYSKQAPLYGRDYTVGDVITARVKKNGKVRVNGAVRVWAADIAITDEGEEQPTLILEPQ